MSRLLLIEVIERLSSGATVTEVAFALGYSGTSSFVYMFRRNLGVSSGSYRVREAGLLRTNHRQGQSKRES
jgi:AraC-like DNA-binding protein